MENGVMEYMETASLRDSRFKTDVDGKTATCVSSPTFRYSIIPLFHGTLVSLLLLLTVTAQADVLFLAHFDKAVPGAEQRVLHVELRGDNLVLDQ